MIDGKKLIALGYEPGKWFGEAIDHANAHALDDQALLDYLDSVRTQYIDPFEQPMDFHKNIEASNEEEQTNVDQVIRTMEKLMTTPTVVKGAIMPDACPTGGMGQIPVGGIVATRNAIHPAMHSADVCCSVMMTNFGKADPQQVLDAAHSVTHFGPGGRKDLFLLPKPLQEKIKSNRLLDNDRCLKMARTHLGTQGDGNHFLFVGRSLETGDTILVTHHGSRGFGASLYQEGMRIAERFRRELSPKTLQRNAWIPADSEEGRAYWEALQVVREWTRLNHQVLHDATGRRLKTDVMDRFWNEHNFVFREDDLYYHAKGATPLDDKFVPDSKDGLRLVPLNMREPVLIIRGETTATNLGFAPHGAGRNVSRSQHKRKHEHKTDAQLFAEETEGLDVRFYAKHIDISELPSAYKNAQAVKDQMATFGLGEVVDEIVPYGCIMAGDWQRDAPWRKKKERRKQQPTAKKVGRTKGRKKGKRR